MLVGAQATQRVVSSTLTLHDWIAAAVILAVALAVGWAGKAIVCRVIGRPDDEARAVELIGRIVSTVAVVAGIIYALAALGIRLGALVGALGIGGLAIAFAAQSILANFLASVILQVRRPFRRGDQIETNDCEGTVVDVNFRTVVLRTFGGQRVMVPSADVLGKPIVNHTVAGRRRTTLDVGVAYDADLEQVREVLLAAVGGVDAVREQPAPEAWVESFGTSSINVVVRFWHPPDQASVWRVRSGVAVAVKRALDEAGIEMPLPQRVVTFADRDGDRNSDRNHDHDGGAAANGRHRDGETAERRIC